MPFYGEPSVTSNQDCADPTQTIIRDRVRVTESEEKAYKSEVVANCVFVAVAVAMPTSFFHRFDPNVHSHGLIPKTLKPEFTAAWAERINSNKISACVRARARSCVCL